MPLATQRERFLELLSSQAGVGDMQISEKVLREAGLGDRTFWTILCPELKKTGVLTSFDDPNDPFSEFSRRVQSDPRFRSPLLASYGPDDEKSNDTLSLALRPHFKHRFRVGNLEKGARHQPIREGEKVRITFSPTRGLIGPGNRSYPIKKDSKRRQALQMIWETQGVDGIPASDFDDFWSGTAETSKEIKGINRAFKKGTGLKDDLILALPSAGGYMLNRDKYEFETSG